MLRTDRSRQASASRPSFSRFGLALAASALVHGLLLSGPPRAFSWRGWASSPAIVPMTVRLQPPSVQVAEVAVVPAPGSRPAPVAAPRPAARTKSLPDEHAAPRPVQSAAEASALPFVPDPHYYPARDLDSYPWPLAPLELDRLPEHPGGQVRLEMLIDEKGVVQEVVFVQPARPGPAEEGLRAALAATHFMPGRRDGRAVKSRVTLRLDFATADGR